MNISVVLLSNSPGIQRKAMECCALNGLQLTIVSDTPPIQIPNVWLKHICCPVNDLDQTLRTIDQSNHLLILNDQTVSSLDLIPHYMKSLLNVPRAGGFFGSAEQTAGYTKKNYLPLFGTLWNGVAIQQLGPIQGMGRDSTNAASVWSKRLTSHGWGLYWVPGKLSHDPEPTEPSIEQESSTQVTICLPCRDDTDPHMLNVVKTAWLKQSVKPKLMLIGNQSDYDIRLDLTGVQGLSRLYGVAYEACQTDYLIYSHTDVLPLSRTLLSDLKRFSGTAHPITGFRDERYGFPVPRNRVNMTLTTLYRPLVQNYRPVWNVDWLCRHWGKTDQTMKAHDPLNESLRLAGIVPHIIAEDPTHPHITNSVHHFRQSKHKWDRTELHKILNRNLDTTLRW